ncbi:DUF4019 domain-containing protein [Luteimonas sp. e5]
MTLLVLAGAAHATDAITLQSDGEGGFTAILKADRALRTEDAQRRLLPTLARACGALSPVMGRYRFTSRSDVSAAAEDAASYEFIQNFTCSAQIESGSTGSTPISISQAEQERLASLVASQTRNWLAMTEAEQLRAFHDRFSPTLDAMLPLAQWLDQQARFHQQAGPLQPEPALKVTPYIDPPGAPEPGIYLAVDFQASYARAPFRCGYVMWLHDRQSRLSILRIEDGFVDADQAASLSEAQLSRIKAGFRCIAP